MTAVADHADAALGERLHELEEQLERERARNAGLERGIEALTSTVEDLRAENAALRQRSDDD